MLHFVVVTAVVVEDEITGPNCSQNGNNIRPLGLHRLLRLLRFSFPHTPFLFIFPV